MSTPKIFESEYRFCQILWQVGEVSAAELARICQERLGWKRTTTYTVIKRLGERGVLENSGGTVKALVTREEAQASEIGEMLEKKFDGSLPMFVTAFARYQNLSDRELEQIRDMIEKIRRGECK